MQSAGHTVTHCGSSCAPTHSVHFAGSIRYIGEPAVMAVLGQGSTQASHAVQSSLMISAIPVSRSFRG